MKTNKVNIVTFSVSVLFLFLSLLVSGCQTRAGIEDPNFPGIIAKEGNLLIHFNLTEDKEVLDRFIGRYSKGDLSDIISRTESLTVSTEGFDGESEYSILAVGKYPRFLTNIAIGREDNWVKHRDKYVWWENSIEGLYTSVPISSIALISNSNIQSELSSVESGKRFYIPEYVKMEFDRAAVTFYSRLPGSGLYSALNIPSGKMSIQEILLSVDKSNEKYEISGFLQFSDSSEARIFSTALKLGLLMKLREGGRLSVMQVIRKSRIEAVESRIIVEGIALNPEDFMDIMDGDTGISQEN